MALAVSGAPTLGLGHVAVLPGAWGLGSQSRKGKPLVLLRSGLKTPEHPFHCVPWIKGGCKSARTEGRGQLSLRCEHQHVCGEELCGVSDPREAEMSRKNSVSLSTGAVQPGAFLLGGRPEDGPLLG